MRFTAVVTHEPPWYVARCIEADAAAQGDTAEAATANLREALTASDAVEVVSPRPVVLEIDVPARVAPARQPPRGVDRAALVRHVAAAGWVTVQGERNDVFHAPAGSPVVVVPRGVEHVAAGVFRLVARAAAEEPDRTGAAEALARLDALFARNPHDDATRVVREERDAR